MRHTEQQEKALTMLGWLGKFVFFCVLLGFLIWCGMQTGCARNNVGDEKNNPAPSSSLTLMQAQAIGIRWALDDQQGHAWSTPTPTSSMVPYLDSRSVLLLERITQPVKIHDILVVNEGPGRENICHQVVRIDGEHVFIDGANNKWPDGWFPIASAKYRVAGIIYSRG